MIDTTPDGATVTDRIGETDRGTLWWATRHREHDRIVRLVDSRFCDDRFRDALRRLRERPPGPALRIVAEGWISARYAVEYAVDPPARTLGEMLADRPRWLDRLRLVGLLCDAMSGWQRDPSLPACVGLHNLVFAGADQHAPLRLLPCPACAPSTPWDFAGMDGAVLAAIAPEVIRGVPLHQRAQDQYALGTLAAQAVGCQVSALRHRDSDRIEAQARGALLRVSQAHSELPPVLRGTPPVERLFGAIERYRYPVPEARPDGVGELRSAIDDTTDLLALAEAVRPADPDACVLLLSWADESDPGLLTASLQRAAEVCLQNDEPVAALEHLDRALRAVPNHLDLRRLRAEVLWQLFQADPADTNRLADLVADLSFVDQRDTSSRPPWRRRIAEAYRLAGDLAKETDALDGALARNGVDLQLLLRYAECLKSLGALAEFDEAVRRARKRIANLALSHRLDEERRREWDAAFDALLE
jgi:hypothetical protein